jgi:tetratricopeptide (TPR) repeat protein
MVVIMNAFNISPRVTLMGSFAISAGDIWLGLSTRKTRGVLAYVATRAPDAVTVEDLGEMFWACASARERRHSVAQALYTIRHVLGKSVIAGTRQVTIDKTRISTDFWDLDDALAKDQIVSALGLYGPFLPDLVLDSASYDAWRFTVATKCRSRISRKVSAAIDGASRRRDWRAVESICELAIQKLPPDRLLFDTHIRAQLARANDGEAETSYIRYSNILRDSSTEGLAPWSHYLSLRPQRSQLVTPSVESSQFVGRVPYLNDLKFAFSEMSRGVLRLVVVSGKAGIGKTALCKHFCEWVTSQRAATIQVTGHEAEQHIPYNTLADILKQCCQLTDVNSLPAQLATCIAELVPEAEYITNPRPVLGPEAAQRRLFEAATSLLEQASERQPILLFVDDIHWVDDTTIKFINFLARRAANKKLFILTAARASFNQQGALEQLVRSTNSANQIHLGEFDERETSTFVESRLRDASTEDLGRKAYSLSGGHPLLLVEILRTFVREGEIDLKMIDLTFVKRSLDVVPKEARQVVEVLAVLNLPASASRLSEFLQMSTTELLEQVEPLRDFCAFEPDGTFRFTHDLIRHGVVKAMTNEKLVTLHLRVADVLENGGASAGKLAFHFDRCGERTRARRYALEAAAMGDLKRAGREALYFYELALSNSDDVEDELFVKGLMASSLVKAGEYDKAAPIITEVLASTSDARNQLKWRSIALLNSHGMKSNLRAKSLLLEARSVEVLAEQVGDPEAIFNALRVQLSLETRLLGEEHDPTIVDRLLTLSDRNPVSRVGAESLMLVAQVIAYQGFPDGLKYARTALAWAEQLSDIELLIKCLRTAGAVHYATGNFQDAKGFYERAVATVQSTGAFLYYAYVFGSYASLLMELDCDSQTESMLNLIIRDDFTGEQAEKVTAKCNRALHSYQRGDYSQCVTYAAEVLSDDAEGMWVEIAVRGVCGLSFLEMGRIADAKDQAVKVESLLTKSRVYGDVSYGYLLLSRLKAIRGEEVSLIGPLRRVVSSRGSFDPIATARMKLALAEVLLRSEPHESSGILNDVEHYAQLHQLKALSEQCNRLRRKQRRTMNQKTR